MDYINYVKESPISMIGTGGLVNSFNFYNAGGGGSPRAVWGGGSSQNTMDFVTIATTGNATDFGDLITGRRWLAGCSNGSRGLFGGGYNTNQIQYITISTESNSQDFGDLVMSRYALASMSSDTRGIFGGGDASGNSSTIDYVTIASAGNA